jgi:predicted TIM-barrel fold metal-dependent hydrolase
MPADEEKLTRMLIAQYDDHDADKLVAKMDAAGIAETVLLAPDFSYVFDAEHSLEDLARQHAAVVARHPGRFRVFFGVDPRWGTSGYDFFERSIDEFGFDGLKIYPPCGFSPSDDRMFPLYEICAARGLPALLHTGPTTPTLAFEYADPYLIDAAARQFPQVDFILAHGGVNFTEPAKLMCNYRPNVYLDFSGFPAAMCAEGWRNHLAALFAQDINHKIIFGTDWPVFSMKDDLKAMVAGLLAADGPMSGLKSADVANIMGGTMRRLLSRRQACATRTRPAGAHAETLDTERLV